jgi:hypothetical protein
MAFDITATCESLKAAIEGTALFSGADITDPTRPTEEGPYAAIYPLSMSTVSTVLNAAIELHVIKVKLFYNPWAENEQERVLKAARLASQVADLFYGDFTIGGSVRNIDIGGQYSSGIEVDFTEVDTRESDAHVADITLPIIVDSATVFAA